MKPEKVFSVASPAGIASFHKPERAEKCRFTMRMDKRSFRLPVSASIARISSGPFHTHQLAFIPHLKAVEFERWAKSCLVRMVGRSYVSKEMLCIRRVRPFLIEANAVQRMWYWFRYIIKTLDPQLYVCEPNGHRRYVRPLFRPWAFQEGDQVDCARLAGGSRNIWTAAQKDAGFTARLFREGPNCIYGGCELDEHGRANAAIEHQPWFTKLVL